MTLKLMLEMINNNKERAFVVINLLLCILWNGLGILQLFFAEKNEIFSGVLYIAIIFLLVLIHSIIFSYLIDQHERKDGKEK